jgi:hypothetical protein
MAKILPCPCQLPTCIHNKFIPSPSPPPPSPIHPKPTKCDCVRDECVFKKSDTYDKQHSHCSDFLNSGICSPDCGCNATDGIAVYKKKYDPHSSFSGFQIKEIISPTFSMKD